MKKLIIAFICLLFVATAYAETWELAIAKRDEDGARKKLGDVIAVKPYPWEWGRMELKHYLILVVDGISQEEAEKMIWPLYQYPDGMILTDGWIDYGMILGKRRFNIDTAKIQTMAGKRPVEWRLCFDPESTYQPFDHGEMIFDFKSDKAVYDKYNMTTIFYGTAPVMEAP